MDQKSAIKSSVTENSVLYGGALPSVSNNGILLLRSLSDDNKFVTDLDKKTNFEVCGKFRDDNSISNLEVQLTAITAKLNEVLSDREVMKNNCERELRDIRKAADEEREELQRKIVRISIAVLEKFCSNFSNHLGVKLCYKKHRESRNYFERLSRKLYRKLKVAALTTNKQKTDILMMKNNLNDKSQKYNSILEAFENLKVELQNTKMQLNDLLNENVSLRKKIEDSRELSENRIGKDRNDKINFANFRDIQRTRELSNLKKKIEQDASTISQLREKLIRSESSNSNKGYLLNNYKIQLSDLSKENENLSSKMKEIETENSILKRNNAQLKFNASSKNNGKEISLGSEMRMKESMQTKSAIKYERSMLEIIDPSKENSNKSIKAMEIKLNVAEYLAAQYFEAIERFLKKIYEDRQEIESRCDLNCSEASEREAHETACQILNITPDELTIFLRGDDTTKINHWLTDLKKITSSRIFAGELCNFLYSKTKSIGRKN